MSTPAVIRHALDAWRAIRTEFQDHLEAQYVRAERDCNAVMLNARGLAAGIDSFSLFYGPRSRVDAYASEELRDWFAAHGRTTSEQYERARTEMPGHGWGSAMASAS